MNLEQRNTNIPDPEDDKTVAMIRGYDTADLDNEKTTALEDDAKTVALIRNQRVFSEVNMDTDKPRVQRGLDELEGEIISGRYQITRRIGKGGMGVVYLASQTNLGRNVCLKVLNPALLDDADAVGRFEREARGLSRLQHPNIVTIFDYGRDGNLAYIVMEYAQGETLGKYLKAHGALSLDDFLPIAVQTLKGIGEAHKMGLIHRDIKPANIVLCELEGEKNFVKILDFGLAKLAQGGEDLTKDQQLVGSASYMSPEQIMYGTSDTRTDVYALGVMFYLMLSGHKPFTGANDNAILYQHVNTQPAPLKTLLANEQHVPDELCQVIDQCLSKDPEKRPQTANDLLIAISFALKAPQLRAGYSSMTLPSVQAKGEEEKIEQPVQPEIPQEMPPEPDICDSLPPKPVADEEFEVKQPKLLPTVIMTNKEGSTEARDRKILFVTVFAVAVIVSIVLVAIITNITGEDKPSVFQTQKEDAQADDVQMDDDVKMDMDNQEDVFASVKDSLEAQNWAEAQTALQKVENEETDEFKSLKSSYEKRIRVGNELENIRKDAQDKTVVDKTHTLNALKKLLEENQDDKDVEAEVHLIQHEITEYPTLTFVIDHISSATLIVDEIVFDAMPESVALEKGTHSVRIKRDGYQEFEEKIELTEDMSKEIKLEPEHKKAVSPKPAGKSSSKSSSLLTTGRKQNSSSTLLLKK